MKISISQVSSIGWSLERDLAHYASVGAQAVGLLITKVEAVGVPSTARAVAASGLRVSGYERVPGGRTSGRDRDRGR